MKVILKADLKGTGNAGELINVSDGYARNYLLPHGLAMLADNKALNELHGREQAEKHRAEMEVKSAQDAANFIADKTVKVYAKAGSNGKLFGSVTSKEISQAINEQYGLDIDKRKIVLQDDIKAYGTVQVEAKMHTGIISKFFVVVGARD